MTFDEIFSQWEIDGKIDRTELGEEAIRTAGILSKYWKMYLSEKKQLRIQEVILKKLRMDKSEFYTLGPHEGTPKDWKLPAHGRVAKNEVDKYLEIDIHIVSEALKTAEQKDKVDLLAAIIDQVKGRGWDIDKKMKWTMWMEGAR